MLIQLLFWLSIIVVCLLFNYLGVPAGWLLGSLLVSIIWSLSFKKNRLNKNIFSFGLALIGVNLGSMLDFSLVKFSLHQFGASIIIGVMSIILGGLMLGFLLHKLTHLDLKTSIFSFIPGGASVVLGVAESQKADLRIVAAFHSARLILFVSIIPLFVGFNQTSSAKINLIEELTTFNFSTLGLVLIVLVSFLFYLRFPLPAGALLYATIITVVLNLFVDVETPLLIAGIGQVLIGATIGLRFDINSIRTLWRIKYAGLTLLFLFIGVSLSVGLFFSKATHVDVWSSILGWIPAGAGEMSSTAILLNLDETVVITIQLIRMYAMYISLLIIIKWLSVINKRSS